MKSHKPIAPEIAFRTVRRAMWISCAAGGLGGVLLAWLNQFSPMAYVLAAAVTATCSACLCARLLHRIAGLNNPYQPRAELPRLESRLRFSRVLGIHMLKRHYKKQNVTFSDVVASHIQPASLHTDDDGDFRPATIVYENMGRYSNSDTFSREQGLATARIALLSMDHTKQIPH